jgi:acyl-coenzyme A synthetase/AMP-(fatty) acid ligase
MNIMQISDAGEHQVFYMSRAPEVIFLVLAASKLGAVWLRPHPCLSTTGVARDAVWPASHQICNQPDNF